MRKFGVTGLAILMLACGDPGLGPGNIAVNSEPNMFRLQVLRLENVTDVTGFGWVNDGTQASVDLSPFLTSGSATLTVRDADSSVVYQDDIGSGSDGDTATGAPGRWTIEIALTAASGSFSVDLLRKN